MASRLHAQVGAPDSFRYQAIARDISGVIIPGQAISVKVGVHSSSSAGILVWEETHSLTTNVDGLYLCMIGNGTSTGAGTLLSFASIPWQSTNYYIEIAVDYNGSTIYTTMGNIQLQSVPYSFYSSNTQKINIPINALLDTDTAGCTIGKILAFDGTVWRPSAEVDPDTVNYSTYSNNANFSLLADNASNVLNSIISDTANYATNFLPYNWSIIGNSISSSQFIGSQNNSDFVFTTSAVERMRLTSGGKLGIGTINPGGQVHLSGNDGILALGTFGSGILPDSSYNTRFMWFPKKAAMRMGEISSNRWNENNIGNYSFAAGYNCQASGLYSFATGYNSVALNENCVSIGKDCSTDITSGAIVNGGSIAMGDSCIVLITRSIALGYKVVNNGGVGMGYRVKTAYGASTSAWGAYTNGDGLNSIAMGYYASNNAKATSFVFGDASSTVITANTVANQFMARASGGVIFYSDSSLTNGVQIFPGGGSWASVSDSSKKEQFKYENPEVVLQKIVGLKILSWNYKSQNKKIRHIGPMAQDFYSAFLIGENSTSICTIDMDGVTMLGIKALEKRTSILIEKLNPLEELKSELKSIDNFSSIENRINKIEGTLLTNSVEK